MKLLFSNTATPILVEPEIETYNIAVNKIEEKITGRTKAIIAVHLQGRPADMDSIVVLARKYGYAQSKSCRISSCIGTNDANGTFIISIPHPH